MNMDRFDYELPAERIAQTPLERRDGSRLMSIDRRTGTWTHQSFAQWSEYIAPGDVIVLNESKVIPARLYGRKNDSEAHPVELLLIHPFEADDTAGIEASRWVLIGKPGARMRVGDVIAVGTIGQPAMTVVIEAILPTGERVARLHVDRPLEDVLQQWGNVPLPPYITQPLHDPDRYQTVYAKQAGSVAAPTAGLHLTQDVLATLRERGAEIVTVTLHVGIGTFRPVKATMAQEHEMHAEYYAVPAMTMEALVRAKREGRRVIAIGTTVVRTLETIGEAVMQGHCASLSGWSSLFLCPGYSFRLVDALLTNFHLPRSTLLLLVSALAGETLTMSAYREAVQQQYRFYSFGDAMWIYQSEENNRESNHL